MLYLKFHTSALLRTCQSRGSETLCTVPQALTRAYCHRRLLQEDGGIDKIMSVHVHMGISLRAVEQVRLRKNHLCPVEVVNVGEDLTEL